MPLLEELFDLPFVLPKLDSLVVSFAPCTAPFPIGSLISSFETLVGL